MNYRNLLGGLALVLSMSAFAQTSVNVYGVVDAAASYQSNNRAQSQIAVQSGGLNDSVLGFKGSEDLGNGTRAFFVIEEGLNVDSNASAFTHRQTLVGLGNAKAGSIALGRQFSPGHDASMAYDVFGASAYSATQILTSLSGSTIAYNDRGRWNNTASYKSPSVYGLTANAMYRAGEVVNSVETHEGYAAGLNYERNKLGAAYVYHHTESSASGSGAGNANGTQNEHFVGLKYDAALAKLTASWQSSNWDGNGQGAGSYSQVYSVGSAWHVTPKTDLVVNAAYVDVNGQQARGDGWSGTAGGLYKFSKRTTAYVMYNYTDASNMTASTYNGVGAATSSTLAVAGSSQNTVVTGLSHAF